MAMVLLGTAVARTSLMEIVIVTEIKPMPLACAEEAALQMQIEMAFVTMSMIVLDMSMPAGFATDQAPFMTAGAMTSQMAIVIAQGTNSMP